MKRFASTFLVLCVLAPSHLAAQQQESYDYWRFQRDMVRYGQQAIFMCNGLFTSNRTVDQVFEQELAYLDQPVGTANGGDYEIDRVRRAVAIGTPGGTPVMRVAFREGLGCVILAPDQTLEDIESLPILETPPMEGDPAEIPWPDGDLIEDQKALSNVNAAILADASNWAFERSSSEQVTLSLIVVHGGKIIHERYAPGFDISTRTRTWSTALRNVLNMSSGLATVDNRGMEYATGSGMSYWAGASSVRGALSRALFREPGTMWDYENYDTLLGVYAMKLAIGDDQKYLEFPRSALFDRIGMRNTLLSVDRFGDFVLSSQVYTNARDLARFGMLYLQNGTWHGERLLSEDWIDFVRTPAPATIGRGGQYGGQWWLVPEGRDDVPADAYSTAGNRGQYVVIVPSHDLVIVRRGLDYGRQGFNRWDLTREVLKAIGTVSDSR